MLCCNTYLMPADLCHLPLSLPLVGGSSTSRLHYDLPAFSNNILRAICTVFRLPRAVLYSVVLAFCAFLYRYSGCNIRYVPLFWERLFTFPGSCSSLCPSFLRCAWLYVLPVLAGFYLSFYVWALRCYHLCHRCYQHLRYLQVAERWALRAVLLQISALLLPHPLPDFTFLQTRVNAAASRALACRNTNATAARLPARCRLQRLLPTLLRSACRYLRYRCGLPLRASGRVTGFFTLRVFPRSAILRCYRSCLLPDVPLPVDLLYPPGVCVWLLRRVR